jgi:hypothetical protein
VRLLDESTDVSRPTEALDLGGSLFRLLGGSLFRLLPTENYNPENEVWEFKPGSVVRLKRVESSSEAYLLAVLNSSDT